jgi:hypothetical protein
MVNARVRSGVQGTANVSIVHGSRRLREGTALKLHAYSALYYQEKR